jgi:hypothetical protein
MVSALHDRRMAESFRMEGMKNEWSPGKNSGPVIRIGERQWKALGKRSGRGAEALDRCDLSR